MRLTCFLLFATIAGWGVPRAAAQAVPDPRAKYESVIARGRDRLLVVQKKPGSGEAALAGYALLKAGISKDHPHIQELAAATVERINRGVYQSGPEPQHHVYEAACDAMLLADVDPVRYQPQLATLRDYLIRKQLSNGAWYYPSAPPDAGDTSITQFALLGLWAAKRTNLDVPQSTWDNAARWLLSTQRPDGGFAYHPFAGGGGNPIVSTHTMTAAGCGSLLLIKHLTFSESAGSVAAAPAASKKRFGVLENLPNEVPATVAASSQKMKSTLREAELEAAIRRASGWIADHYDAIPEVRLEYCEYALERVGTLMDVDVFGTHRWYDEGARRLASRQLPSGEWVATGAPTENIAANAFALLFLSRATQQIVGPPAAKVRLHGGGLLGGGRGLPDDLSRVTVSAGEIKQRAPKAAIDSLLADLERPTAVVDEKAQTALVEAVQLEQRDQLVGQITRLQKLVRDPRPEVRQVAVWALGRSDDLRQAPRLIAALEDANADVAAEASLALCVLSRQPEGVRDSGGKGKLVPAEPPDPAENEDSAIHAQRVQTWQKAARRAWHAWYLQVRPYDERDDRHQLRGP